MRKRTEPLVPFEPEIERRLRKLRREFREFREEEAKSSSSSSIPEFETKLNMGDINHNGHNGNKENEIPMNTEDNRSVRKISHSHVNSDPYSFYT